MDEKVWVLYILECKDGTYYTGITDNLSRRLSMHNQGKGAKYTRGRTPVVLRYTEQCGTHSQALRRECQVKKLSRQEKQVLLSTSSEYVGVLDGI